MVIGHRGGKMAELMREVMETRAHYLEMMAAAYFKVTDIDPREAELVEERRDGAIVFYFRKKPEQE